MERNSGVYHLIQDFRDFKVGLQLDIQEGGDDDKAYSTDLYDAHTVFTFYEKSLDKNVGKGQNEKIPMTRVCEFADLMTVPHWRRKLDDSWTEGPFILDKIKWNSVEQYLLGARYKKGFPDVYEAFSKMSDLVEARKAQTKVGVKIAGELKKNVKVDDDFASRMNEDGIVRKGREVVERESAVDAKFRQNEDLQQILLHTKDALLQHFERQSPPVADEILMKLRQQLQKSGNKTRT
jgi:predicted NAD-dependent protein-ADP-ribosyltransferase YbiA (DUF1768 family)